MLFSYLFENSFLNALFLVRRYDAIAVRIVLYTFSYQEVAITIKSRSCHKEFLFDIAAP